MDEFPEVLTPEQAAKYLQLDITTIYKKLKAGTIPGGKVAGRWRLLKSELDAIMRGKRDV